MLSMLHFIAETFALSFINGFKVGFYVNFILLQLLIQQHSRDFHNNVADHPQISVMDVDVCEKTPHTAPGS